MVEFFDELEWFERGSNSVGRVTAFQAVGRGFESRLPLRTHTCSACVAQLVEHFLGKEEVIGSIPIASSNESEEDEGITMRDIITLECTECKRRNYSTTKNKKKQTGRVEYKKYCPWCKKRTPHKETK